MKRKTKHKNIITNREKDEETKMSGTTEKQRKTGSELIKETRKLRMNR